MAPPRKKPGSKKGQSKPLKRTLDAGFPKRLEEAIGGRDIPALAKKIVCSRAVIHKHLNGRSKTIEAILLAELCAELKVAPGWLVTNIGTKTGLSPDEDVLLRCYRFAKKDERVIILGVAEKVSQAAEK